MHDFNAILFLRPVTRVDHGVADWFHQRLTPTLSTLLHALSWAGSATFIALFLTIAGFYLIYQRRWRGLLLLNVVVPGGMLLNELLKVAVHRPRPFVAGPFVDWSGYSFASGHTIAATLLYGLLAIAVFPTSKNWWWRIVTAWAAVLLVLFVGFSRIALGAHYLTDVIAAMLLGLLWLGICTTCWRALTRPARRIRSESASDEPIGLEIREQEPALVASEA